ncbi:hypothetical protein ACU6QH_08050 [Aeromonas veronii]|uniref:Uncharacterized protein n=1 Tax=Aeromonas media TaxID=651 RepID=A0A6M4YCM0_AERME|nr:MULTISPECIES: hypothetical protein [Aeromonas]MBP4032999.1 hypothetical protein [Aeromonas sp. PrichA-15]QJT22988.1 hypothetical protein E4184_17275 [Aeromonas media]QYK79871.1 hypothetical protein IBG34_12380 [Aeromonas media]WVM46300.1 hypothetical protein V0242_04335 [Aeromonas hydrophila]
MEISQARSLVTQVRHAHRLLEGFYERILPQLDKLASEAANANFRFWGSMEGEGIGKSTSKPSSRAAWSFLPLFQSFYCYQRGGQSEHAKQGDIVLYFRLNTDDAFIDAVPEAMDYDPHTGSSSLELHLYCYTKDAAYSWDDIAEEYPWAKHDVWTTQDQDYPEVACCVKRFSLETVIATPGDIHDWISSQLAHLPSKI